MAWRQTILYLTRLDAMKLVEWINLNEDVAWILLESKKDLRYTWVAKDQLDDLESRNYAIWHKSDSPIEIPTGKKFFSTKKVRNPYKAFSQVLSSSQETTPWFGGYSPGLYKFSFKEAGLEQVNSLGRSDFSWPGNHFKLIGQPASPEQNKWWGDLQKFIKKNSVAIPWPYPEGIGRSKAYAFQEAYSQIIEGRHPDANP